MQTSQHGWGEWTSPMTFAPASFTVLSTPLTASIPVLFTCLSMQLSSTQPAGVLKILLCSRHRALSWGLKDEEFLHLKDIRRKQMDGWETKEMCKLSFLHLHFTSITATSECIPMWISSSVRATHRRDLGSTSYLLRPWDLHQPSLELSSTGSPSSMLACVLFPFSIFHD